MTPTVEIGLPDLTDEKLEDLAERCEDFITQHIFRIVPEKSIENLFVSCALALDDGQLDVDIQIDADQIYDTNHSLDDLLDEAGEKGMEWLEQQLMELKEK